MSFILYNPQKSGMFGLTVFNWVNKTKWPAKYNYFVEYLRNNQASIYFDNFGSSFPFTVNKWIYGLLKYVEIYLWMVLNKLNPLKVKIIFDTRKLSPTDQLFFFASDFLQKVPHPQDGVMTFNCHKLIHFSHYFFRTQELYSNIIGRSDVTLVAENDLFKNSEYFRRYLPKWRKTVYTLPFAVTERFKNNNNFEMRDNRCLAVGSFMTMERADYNWCMLDFYDSDTIQPLRKEIYQAKHQLCHQIECKISYVNEFWKLQPNSKENLSKLQTLKNFYYKKVKNNWGKSSHFKSDIVKIYNAYKMVFSSDDSGDLPSISFFEAMACGCACFAIPGEKFRDLGLIENVHYLAFDGTLASLLERIKYYQTCQQELHLIAKNGEEFAKKTFRSARIAEVFLADVNSLEMGNDLNKNIRISSFISD